MCCVCENRPRATRPALPSATHQKSLFSFYAVILIMATLANDGNGDASTASYDDGEEVHPLDAMHPCCLKEAKLRKKALQRYEALAKVDITRIALERTKLEKALPPPSSSIENLHMHSGCCDDNCNVMEKTNYTEEEPGAEDVKPAEDYGTILKQNGGYVREADEDEDDEDTDSDLDAMLEGFETSDNIFEDNLEHLKDKRLAKLKVDVAENALKREQMQAIQGVPMKQVTEEDIARIIQNAQRAVCLIVRDESIFIQKGERELQALTQEEFISKCVHDRMKAMAPHVPYTQFTYLSEPSAKLMENFKLNALPAIICIDYCNVIAQTKSIVEMTDGSLNIRSIISNFDTWLDNIGMLRPKDFSDHRDLGADKSSDEESDFEEIYDCGIEGCKKHFPHEHIGADGLGRDADTLGGF